MNDATDPGVAARSRRFGALACTFCALLLFAACGGDYPQSAMDPAGEMSTRLHDLFTGILWWAIGVFVIVEGALLVAIFRFRSGRGADEERAEPLHMHGNTILELAWTLAPAVVLVFIAVPTMTTIWEVDRPTTDPDALEVEVVGHQWWWEFRYPEFDLVTANELHLPAGRTVQFRLTSADVIHSFWFPRQGGKRDVIPGRENVLWFRPDSIGRFPGQCAEFCGTSHALMKMEVVVESAEDFADWVERQTRPSPALRSAEVRQPDDTTVAREIVAENAPAAQNSEEPDVRQDADLATIVTEGQQLLMSKGCIACHRVDGTPAAGVLGPDLSHVASRATIAAGILENNRENMIRWLRNPAAVKPGALMPNLQLSEEELAKLADYLGSLE